MRVTANEPEPTRPPHVMIGVPNSGSIHRDVYVALSGMRDAPCGCRLSVHPNVEFPVDGNRNHIINDFLAGDYDYLLFMDSDNPCSHNPLTLVKHDLDIVACPTPVYDARKFRDNDARIPFGWNVYRTDEATGLFKQTEERDGIVEIDAAGTGCMLIARRVLEKVHADRPCFQRGWGADGRQARGSDVHFCVRAKEHGFKVWAAWTHMCHHYKEIDLLAMWRLLDMRDIRHANTPNINTAEYWDAAWQKREERILPQYERIVELVGADAQVLDYGCGRGDLLAMLGPNAVGYDISEKALEICRERGLVTTQLIGSLTTQWDIVVSTQVLEHVDNDRELIEQWFEMAPRVIFSVPWDCMPPGMEREHRRVYDTHYVRSIMPEGVTYEVEQHGPYMLVVAERAEARV
jgi:hypothetical protein